MDNTVSLIRSLLGHREGRSADEVLAEVELAAWGASIDDIAATRVQCHTALCTGGCQECREGRSAG